MEMTVTGRKMNVKDWMKDYCDEKIAKTARVFDIEPLTIEVVLSREKNPANPTPAKCEVTLRAGGHVIHVEENEQEIHAAIDVASAKVMRQLRKYKTRLQDKRILTAEREAQRKAEGATGEELDLDSLMEELSEKSLVREKGVTLVPMTIEEAIFEHDMLGHDFFLYIDADTNKFSVLYTRKDGSLGVIYMKN